MHPSSSRYPNIPKKLWEFYDQLKRKRSQHKLIEAIKEQGYDKTWRGINDVFYYSSKATGMTPDKLYEEIGFNQNDFDDNNFQALLGILRTINILSSRVFKI